MHVYHAKNRVKIRQRRLMKLHTLQVLRAIAALLVVLLHQGAMEQFYLTGLGATETNFTGTLFSNGYAGVDLFFVISGFVMVYVTHDRLPSTASVREFLFARVTRIYPVYWLFTLALALYFMITQGVPWEVSRIATDDPSGPPHFLSSLLLLPQAVHPIIGPGWTLVHEMYFYLIFALFLFASADRRPRLLRAWGVIVFLGALAGLSGPHAANVIMLIFHPMTLEFIAGAFVAYAILARATWRPGLLFTVGLVSYLAAIMVHPPPSPFTEEWGRVFVYTLPCCLMVYGAVGLNGRLPATSPLLRAGSALGDWSYSLYLSHIIVIVGVHKGLMGFAAGLEATIGLPAALSNLLVLGSPGIADNVFYFVMCLIACTLVAAFVYHVFERPIIQAVQPIRKRLLTEKKAAVTKTAAL